MRIATVSLVVVLAVAVIGTQSYGLSVERRERAELLAAFDELREAVAAAQPKPAASLNMYLPVPGLGDVKFTAEVPTEDIAKLAAGLNRIPGASTVSGWLFSEDTEE